MNSTYSMQDMECRECEPRLVMARIQFRNSWLESHLRQADQVARLGGDEFAVLLPETTSESAAAVLRKLHSLLEDTMRQRATRPSRSASAQ